MPTASPSRAIVSIQNLAFRYPGAPDAALRHVTWDIPAGSFALLAGPSGSGKSTLLRSLNGLVPHFSGGRFGGKVVVAGRDTRRHGPRELAATTGFVFQDPEAQLVTPRVEDELAFSLEQLGVPQRAMRVRIEEVLDLLGIAHLRHRDVGTLSGGERQRVAIASVMALRPRILALDEPTSQLDPWGAEEVIAGLIRLNDDLGLTIVLAEHRLERAAAHADTLRFLPGGDASHLVGTPSEVAAAPEVPARLLPPVTQLGRALGWSPVPLTVKEARTFAGTVPLGGGPAGAAGGMTRLGEPIIETRDLSLGHRTATQTVEVLNGVNLTVRAGEIVALMGRNGSGKSTLLRALAGVHAPLGGEILRPGRAAPNDGHDPSSLAGAVAYLPQNPGSILFQPRVRDEIEFTQRQRGRSNVHVPDPDQLMARLGLTHVAERNPHDLSGGERQRVAIAATLASGARLLLLDEPTRGMDGLQKAALGEILKALSADGIAIVVATHDVEMMAGLASRVILLGGGEIVADGPPRDVLAGALSYGTQINKLFGGSYLSVSDVLDDLRP